MYINQYPSQSPKINTLQEKSILANLTLEVFTNQNCAPNNPQELTHLPHQGGLASHVRPCDKYTWGQCLLIVCALLFLIASTTNKDVIGDEVITKIGFGDTGVPGSSEVQERGRMGAITWQNNLWFYHQPVPTLTVSGQTQQHICNNTDNINHYCT